MIVMDVKLDNFCAFKNFHINMSYPKRIKDSYIQGEYLEERPNFRYKKVNILMGANATGKTSFGRMLMYIFNFMDKKQFEKLTKMIGDNKKEASFAMEFVTDQNIFYRIDTKIAPKSEGEYKISDIDTWVRKIVINKTDNYESCERRLNKIERNERQSYIQELEKIDGLSWFFEYPEDALNSHTIPTKNVDRYLKILENTLKVLDPSIEKVEKVEAVENTFVIRMANKDVIMQDGKIIDTDILSSGTKAGIDVASVVAAIGNGEHEFYYCDEKFSYIHSDVEKAFLSVMIEELKVNDQLFFTTHNADILDLPLPRHSFVFFKKDVNDDEQPIKCISASQYIKRNTDSLHNAYDNDLFSSAPAVEKIFEIAELE